MHFQPNKQHVFPLGEMAARKDRDIICIPSPKAIHFCMPVKGSKPGWW